jgi:hypothetical protein
MLRHQIPRRRKAVHGMAFLAISLRCALRELAPMEIGVAVAASAEFQPLLGLSGNMALGTIDRPMFPFERVTRFGVIEIDRVDQMPAVGVVAGTAIFSQLPCVGISMACAALGVLQVGILHIIKISRLRLVGHDLVAFQAGNSLMFPGECEFGCSMVKPRGRLPRRLGMTLDTILTQLRAMFIAMAADTVGWQPQKCSA